MRLRFSASTTKTSILVTVLFAVLSLALGACGGDPYSGVWRASNGALLRIEESDDGWTVTDARGRSFACTESDKRLINTRANDEVLERRGQTLVLIEGGIEFLTFTRVEHVPSPWPSEPGELSPSPS